MCGAKVIREGAYTLIVGRQRHRLTIRCPA
jgi:hypothetical protein